MSDLEKPLTEPQIRYVCHEMCKGLAFLHKMKVIHRDLKAGNVLLTLDGEVKLGKKTQPNNSNRTFMRIIIVNGLDIIVSSFLTCNILQNNNT